MVINPKGVLLPGLQRVLHQVGAPRAITETSGVAERLATHRGGAERLLWSLEILEGGDGVSVLMNGLQWFVVNGLPMLMVKDG